jgi:hypothetical protein
MQKVSKRASASECLLRVGAAPLSREIGRHPRIEQADLEELRRENSNETVKNWKN